MIFVRSTLLAFAFVVVLSRPSPVRAQQWNCETTPAQCTTSGNVGIGTTSPFIPVNIVAPSVAANQYAPFVLGTSQGGNAEMLMLGVHDGDYSFIQAEKPGVAYRNLALNPMAGNVGIGTTNPASILSVRQNSDSDVNGGLSLTNTGGGSTGKIIQGSDNNFYVVNQSTNAIYFGTGRSDLGTWGLHMSILHNGSIGIGTVDPCNNAASASVPNCKLSVNGGIQAQAVVVNSNWSDYVFAPDYRLAPLSEVADYIKDNHHLPGIPSETEVQQSGVSLGDMQSKLLAKIEELTLHMIQTDQRDSRLEQQNKDLLEQNQAIRKEIETLKARMSK